jgi:hypothetical protein
VKSAQKSQQVATDPRDELKQYLSAQLEVMPSILHWWGVSCHFLEGQKSSDFNQGQHHVPNIVPHGPRLSGHDSVGVQNAIHCEARGSE